MNGHRAEHRERPAEPDEGAASHRPPATIASQQDGESWRLLLEGELDASNAANLQQAIGEILAASPRELQIDLSEVSFLDSAGLRALVRAKDSCDEREVALRLVESRHRGAMTVFEATGLGHLLRLSPQPARAEGAGPQERARSGAAAETRYECAKCGHTWGHLGGEPPAKCPSCHSRAIGPARSHE